MKKSGSWTVMLALFFAFVACEKESEKTELTTESEKLSYAMGMNIGGSLKIAGPDIDIAALIQGIKDTLTGRTPLLTLEEKEQYMKQFRAMMLKKQGTRTNQVAEMNKKEGEEFLKQNQKKPGIMTTETGLQYEVLVSAEDGAQPKKTDQVKVHYRGTHLSGTEFDSSRKQGGPATFQVSGVIKGWTEGLQLMNVGSKYRFFIPSELAYGPRGNLPHIGPNETLIFEVELLEIFN